MGFWDNSGSSLGSRGSGFWLGYKADPNYGVAPPKPVDDHTLQKYKDFVSSTNQDQRNLFFSHLNNLAKQGDTRSSYLLDNLKGLVKGKGTDYNTSWAGKLSATANKIGGLGHDLVTSTVDAGTGSDLQGRSADVVYKNGKWVDNATGKPVSAKGSNKAIPGVNPGDAAIDAVKSKINFLGGGKLLGGLIRGAKPAAEEVTGSAAGRILKSGHQVGKLGGTYAGADSLTSQNRAGKTAAQIAEQTALSTAGGYGAGFALGAGGKSLGEAARVSQDMKAGNAFISKLKNQAAQSKASQLAKGDQFMQDNHSTAPRLNGGETATPRGLPAARNANRTPGGAVLVDENSPEAQIVANAGKPGKIQTNPGKRGQNVTDIFAPKASASAEQVTAAGRKIADANPYTPTTPKPTASTPLHELMGKWDNLRNGNASKISHIKLLNDIIEHPDASQAIKEQAMAERDTLTAKGMQDKLATEHSLETGQPVAASHDTLAAGHTPRGAVYQDIQQIINDRAEQANKRVPKIEDPNSPEAISAEAPNRAADAQKQGGLLRSAYNQAKGFFGAINASKLSQEAAGSLSKARATAENLRGKLKLENQKTTNFFKGKSETENVANISHYERTGQFAEEPHPGYSEQYHHDMEQVHAIERKVFGEDKVGYVTNYIRRNFRITKPGEEQGMANALVRQFGSKSPLKGRQLDMPLDEALHFLRSKGYKVELLTHNPEELRQWSIVNAHRLQAFHDSFTSSLKNGLVSTEHKPGMVKLSRDTVMGLSPVNAGKDYFAYPEVARIMDRATAPGWRNQPLFQTLRHTMVGIGQVTLALPAFHATMTTMNSMAGEVADAIMQAQAKQFGGAAKSLGRAATVVGPAIRDFRAGNTIMKQVKAGEFGPEAEHVLNTAGGRLAMPHEFESGATHAMQEAWKQPDVLHRAGAIGLAPFAAAEQIAKPLMQYAIPRIKLGALMDRASQIVEQHGGIDTPEAQLALQNAQRSLDNRLGEVVMDNKFWNPLVRDLSQLLYLSVGYRSGTVGELGGGALDTVSKNWITKGLTERQAFTIGMVTAAAYTGSIYYALHNGKAPSSLIDAFYPTNGQTDQNGNPVRVQLPSYMRDFKNLYTNPLKEVGPTAPAFKTAFDMLMNTDYKGDEIRNPNDSALTQMTQLFHYMSQSLGPIVVQNQKNIGTDKGQAKLNRLEALMGVSKAPSDVSATPAQKEYYKLLGPHTPKTPEQQAQDATKPQKSLTDQFKSLPIESKIKFFQDVKPKDRQGIDINSFITQSISDLKEGNVKNPDALRAFLKSQGIDTKNTAQIQPFLDKMKAQRHQGYLTRKAKGKTPSQL